MSGPIGQCNNPAVPTSFSGVASPVISSGQVQCGNWQQTVRLSSGNWDIELIDGVPAASFVIASGQDSRLKQVGTKQQYALTISLSDDAAGYTLTPGLTDAQGDEVTPVGNYFTCYSEQEFVCTVANGKITPTGRGSCTVEVRFSVAQVNANWNQGGTGGASSNPTNFIYASIQVTVIA